MSNFVLNEFKQNSNSLKIIISLEKSIFLMNILGINTRYFQILTTKQLIYK